MDRDMSSTKVTCQGGEVTLHGVGIAGKQETLHDWGRTGMMEPFMEG